MLRRPQTVEPAWDDAKIAIQEFGGWVKNADSKLTILAAVVGVTVSLLGTKAADIVTVLRLGGGLGWAVVLIALLALIGLFAVAAIFIGIALAPRSPVAANRFSWPHVANLDKPPSPDSESVVADAWAQAHALAKIAKSKYHYFRLAAGFFGGAIFAAAVCVAVTAWELATVCPT